MEPWWLDLSWLLDTHPAALPLPLQGVRSFHFRTLIERFAAGTCLEAGIADTCSSEVVYKARYCGVRRPWRQTRSVLLPLVLLLCFSYFTQNLQCFRVSISACTCPSHPTESLLFLLWACSNVFMLMDDVGTFQRYEKAQSFVTSQRQSKTAHRQMKEMETGLSAQHTVALVTVQFTPS